VRGQVAGAVVRLCCSSAAGHGVGTCGRRAELHEAAGRAQVPSCRGVSAAWCATLWRRNSAWVGSSNSVA
jgi:hypothetical protein